MSDDMAEALRETIREARAAEAGSGAGANNPAGNESPVGDGEGGHSAHDNGGADSPSEVGDESGGEGVVVDSKSDRARNSDGTFRKGQAVKSEAKAPTPGAKALVKPAPVEAKTGTKAPEAGAPTVTQMPKFKAPQAWKAALREKWGAIPEDVQEEIDRREREAASGIQKHAEAAKFRDTYQQAMAPYLPLLGPDPIKATQSILQTVHALQSGNAATQAKVMAHLIRNYRIDIGALDQELAGQGQQQPSAPQQQAFDPEQLLQAAEQRWEQKHQARVAQTEFQKFMASEPEFLEEPGIKDAMRGLMQAGLHKDYQGAYDAAVWANPSLRAILQQRERAAQANASGNQASTQRAQAASSSVKSQPAPPPPAKQGENTVDVLREEIAKARRGT